MQAGFRAVSSPAVLIAHRAVFLTRKMPHKCLPGTCKISNFSNNKLSIRSTGSSRAKQYAHHQLSRDVDHVPPCIVFFWDSSRTLMEVRDKDAAATALADLQAGCWFTTPW